MNSPTCAKIQHGNVRDKLVGPVQWPDIKMSPGNLREQVDDADYQRGQRPVGVVKNDSQPGK